jgi:hypothetical protein
MAGKAKSVYLTITVKGKLNAVFRKVFFNASDYNAFVKTNVFKAQWPTTEYDIIKETY